jgi:hypothetical protein
LDTQCILARDLGLATHIEAVSSQLDKVFKLLGGLINSLKVEG